MNDKIYAPTAPCVHGIKLMRFFTLLKQNPLSSLMMIVSIVSLSLPVFAAPLPGAFIGSTITVGDTANTYAIADVNYLQGGLHSYATLTERNAITTERRHWGMFAVVYNDSGNNGVYQLTYNNVDTNINNNANWTLFSAGGGGGGTLTLRTNGTDNGSQTLLNLVAGSNITLTDNGSGAITIAASGGGGGGSQWDDVAGGINYDGNVGIGDATLESSTQVTIDTGSNEIALAINPTDTLLRGISLSNLDGTVSALIGNFEEGTGLYASGDTGVTAASNSSTGRALFALQSDDAGHGIYSNAAQNYFSGNVGVGTTAPQYKMHVAVSEYGGIALQNTTQPLQDPSLVSFTMLNWEGDPTLTISGRSGDDSFENGGTVYADIGTLNVGADEDVVIASTTGEIVMLNQTLALTGALRYVDGNEAGSSMLVGDASGNASWTIQPITIENSTSLVSSGLFLSGDGSTAVNAVFLGNQSGYNSEAANSAVFIGSQTGSGAIDASGAVMIGGGSGFNAASAENAVFIGIGSGSNAANAFDSVFLGTSTGTNAANAANSIFIGTLAGGFGADSTLPNTDAYNDTSIFANTSILIGHRTTTGGFSNSIAIGAYAANTATEQFMIGSSNRPINQVVINGVNPYLNFSGTAGEDGFGFRSNGGVLEFKDDAGSWSVVGSTLQLVTDRGNTTTNEIFINNTAYVDKLSLNPIDSSSPVELFVGDQENLVATNTNGILFNLSNQSLQISNGIGNYFEAIDGSSFSVNDVVLIGSGISIGLGAENVTQSNFIGGSAGSGATNATNANFIGYQTGRFAENAELSTFIGQNTGSSAVDAANSIFIGTNAGLNDTVDNTAGYDDTLTFANTSILIGHRTSTAGFSNSIAIGAYATNTATNEFMIGSTQRPINTTRINGASSTQCTITTGTGIACTSDERLKTNIEDLSSSTLDTLLNVKTVTYNWLENPDSPQQVGFLAQDLEQYFPQLVATDSDGYKSVYYAQMTPILVEAIREINTRITSLSDIDTDNSWRDSLTDWFASAQNGIGKLFAREITTKTLCVEDESGSKTCITKGQLDALLYSAGTSGATSTPDPVEETPEVPSDGDEEVLPAPEEERVEPVKPAEDAPVETPAPEAEPEVEESAPVASEEPVTP